MSAGAVAAIDLGATSGRVVLGRVGPDTLETTQVARFPNGPVPLADGLHWNIVGLHQAALGGLRDAFRAEPSIASIGIDSWGVDYGLIRGEALLGEPFHYRDARTARGIERVESVFPHAALFQRNGLQFLSINTVYQLAAEDPDLLGFADTALMIPDLIAFLLTGERVGERSNASTTGLLDPTTREWHPGVLEALSLPAGLFPRLVSAGDRIGSLRADVASSLGVPEGIQVTAVGSHDTASAVVAVPMDPTRAAYVSCGTWGLVGVEVPAPVLTDDARAAKFTNEGGVDGRTRLLHNVMGLWILSETTRQWEREGSPADFDALLAAAADVPADTVPVFDVDDDRFLAPGDMPGRIREWCVEHGMRPPATQAEFARSIIESLAKAFADAARRAADLGGIGLEVIHIVGGGALNELLCQRTADHAGLPVLAGPVEATALGNVLVQARALGLVDGTLEDLRALVARTHAPAEYRPLG